MNQLGSVMNPDGPQERKRRERKVEEGDEGAGRRAELIGKKRRGKTGRGRRGGSTLWCCKIKHNPKGKTPQLALLLIHINNIQTRQVL